MKYTELLKKLEHIPEDFIIKVAISQSEISDYVNRMVIADIGDVIIIDYDKKLVILDTNNISAIKLGDRK